MSTVLFVTCFALPFAVRWWRLLRWGLPVRIVADPDDPHPSAIAGYLVEVARRLDERPERMRLSIETTNSSGHTVMLDFTPMGEMVVSVEGYRPKKMNLRHRWIPEHPVPLVLWSRRQRRKVRLYIDPVDGNRFRVMSSLPQAVPAGLYVACSLVATVGAILVSPECMAVAVGLALGLYVTCAR